MTLALAFTITGLALVSSVVTIWFGLASPLRLHLARLGIPSRASYRLGWRTDPIDRAIAEASKRVWILQTWIPTLSSDIGHWANNKRNHLDFRVLLASDNLLPSLLRARPGIISLVDSNLQILSSFAAIPQSLKIEVRRYSVLPFGPIYIIDDDIHWGIYLSDRDSMQGPHFRCHRSSDMGKLLEESFLAIWEISNGTSAPSVGAEQVAAGVNVVEGDGNGVPLTTKPFPSVTDALVYVSSRAGFPVTVPGYLPPGYALTEIDIPPRPPASIDSSGLPFLAVLKIQNESAGFRIQEANVKFTVDQNPSQLIASPSAGSQVFKDGGAAADKSVNYTLVTPTRIVLLGTGVPNPLTDDEAVQVLSSLP